MRVAGQGARTVFRRLLLLWPIFSILFVVLMLGARAVSDVDLPVSAIVMVGLVVPLIIDKTYGDDLYAWLVGARGEEAVGRILEGLREQGFHAVHDVVVPGIGNIDHVLIGPTGVFALETKAWSGTVYRGKGGRLMCKGRDETRAVRQTKREAMAVKDRLRAAKLSIWVEPVIVLTRARCRAPLEYQGVTAVPASMLVAWVQEGRPRRVHPAIVARAVAAFQEP